MEKNWKKVMAAGAALILAFVIWTLLIMKVDVQPVGVVLPGSDTHLWKTEGEEDCRLWLETFCREQAYWHETNIHPCLCSMKALRLLLHQQHQ